MHIRSISRIDLSDMATIANDAQMNDEIALMIRPHRHNCPITVRQHYLHRYKEALHGGQLIVVAVTDEHDATWTGKEEILGHVFAISTQRRDEASNKSRFSWDRLELGFLRLQAAIAWYTYADQSVDRAAYLQFRKAMSSATSLDDIAPSWEITYLAVAPAHQRKGIGKTLVQAIQAVAAQDDLPIVLVASFVGHAMYRQLGFIDHGSMSVIPGRHHKAMVWYPPPLPAKTAEESDGARIGNPTTTAQA